MALVKIARIGSKRQEMLLESIAESLKRIANVLEYYVKLPAQEPMQVVSVGEIEPEPVIDESEGIEE